MQHSKKSIAPIPPQKAMRRARCARASNSLGMHRIDELLLSRAIATSTALQETVLAGEDGRLECK